MANAEFLPEVHNLVPEARRGKVRDFGEMQTIIPNSLVEAEINLLNDYFRVQVTIAEGARHKAREMMQGLARRTMWGEFEDSHQKLLAVIDVAVRGETTRFSDVSPYTLSAQKIVKKK
jgi:hypothetical protein